MNILIFFIVLTAAIGGEFLTIYLAYLSVSRQKVTQKQLLHASFVVLGYSMMAGTLLGFADLPRSLSFLVAAALVHFMGRRMLQQSNRQAWCSCLIFIGLILLAGLTFTSLMHTSDAFRTLMTQTYK
jgi:hypothetical protein